MFIQKPKLFRFSFVRLHEPTGTSDFIIILNNVPFKWSKKSSRFHFRANFRIRSICNSSRGKKLEVRRDLFELRAWYSRGNTNRLKCARRKINETPDMRVKLGIALKRDRIITFFRALVFLRLAARAVKSSFRLLCIIKSTLFPTRVSQISLKQYSHFKRIIVDSLVPLSGEIWKSTLL